MSSKNHKSKPVETDVKVTRIFQWFNQTQLLCSTFLEGKHQLISLNIENGEFETLYQGHVYWAQYDEGELAISDQEGQIFSVNNLHEENLKIKKQFLPKRPFFLRDGELFFLSKSKELWRYNLQSKGLDYLTSFSRDDTWLNDIDHQGSRLLTSEIQVRQTELVSFHN